MRHVWSVVRYSSVGMLFACFIVLLQGCDYKETVIALLALIALFLGTSGGGTGSETPESGAPACISAPFTLAGWWAGDGNANDIVGSHPGVLTGGASATATGKVDRAFSFDGNNDYVNLSPSLFDGLNAGTLDAWINPVTNTVTQGIFSAIKNGVSDQFSLRMDSAGHIQMVTRDTSGDIRSATGATVIPTDTWTHVAGVFRSGSAANLRVYVNGNIDANTTFSDKDFIRNNVGSVRIGSIDDSNFFEGLIDEVGFFSRALKADEIKAIFDADSLGRCKP